MFLRERLLSEITLLEYGGSAGTRNRNKCFLWEMPMPKAALETHNASIRIPEDHLFTSDEIIRELI